MLRKVMWFDFVWHLCTQNPNIRSFQFHLDGEFRRATLYNLNPQVTLTSLACVSFSDPKWSWSLVWHGTTSSVLHLQECTSNSCPIVVQQLELNEAGTPTETQPPSIDIVCHNHFAISHQAKTHTIRFKQRHFEENTHMGMPQLSMQPSNGYGILHSHVQRGNPLNKEGYK
jgi:hypothetical protein